MTGVLPSIVRHLVARPLILICWNFCGKVWPEGVGKLSDFRRPSPPQVGEDKHVLLKAAVPGMKACKRDCWQSSMVGFPFLKLCALWDLSRDYASR